MGDLRSRARIEQSCSELTSLGNEIKDWFEKRNFGPQYQTQLTTLRSILDQALERLAQELGKIQPAEDAGPVYRQCRSADRRLVWVRRVWEYFAARFDQRLDTRYQKTLKAADEVVWACYAEALRKVEGGDRPKRPVPLPYIEPQYAPRAFTRADLPLEVQANLVTQDRLDSLQALLKEMPIPVVGLPPGSVESPWWLAFIAHEVGHHVLADLRPENKLLRDFCDWLYETSKEADQQAGQPVDEAGAQQWFNWGDEVFADLYSVCCLGSAAAWAMSELENSDEAGLLTPLDRYPAPAVRLGLLACAVEALGVQDDLAIGGLQPGLVTQGEALRVEGKDLRAPARAHLRRAEAIASKLPQLILPNLPVQLTLPGLAGFKAQKFDPRKGRLETWSAYFLKSEAITPEANLLETRLATGGGTLAWREALALAETERAQKILRLQTEIPKMLTENHETGVRSAEEPAKTDVEAHSTALSKWLLDPSWEDIAP